MKILTFVIVLSLVLSGCSNGTSDKRDTMREDTLKEDTMKENNMKNDTMKDNTLKDDTKKDDGMMDFSKNNAGMKKAELDFTLKDTKGNTVSLSDSLGKNVYIKFWATWCPICLAGLDEIEQFSRDKANDEKTAVLTIVSPGSSGEMSTEEIKKWYMNQGLEFTVLLDEGGETARKYGVRGYPTSVFINRDGKVAKKQPGHLRTEDIETILGELQ